jgi:crotonobetainyl-CoA:carnitine CoA-transferase CaiB-like acyl-CoA transferase
MAAMEEVRPGALQGLKVIDLTRVVAGPLATQVLADHGAEVVKIEPPEGDEARFLGPPFDQGGSAAYFSGLNRNKRALALDLAAPAGREVLLRMLGGADVLIENFLPGTMAKWGLDYDAELAARFPRLVYCSITGFGETGPLGGKPGYDAVLQAMSGLMSVNGHAETGPARVGIPVVDLTTGLHAAISILLALAERARSGRGQKTGVTLFDSAYSLMHPHAANWLVSGKEPGLTGNSHPNISPYDTYDAAGGRFFLGIVNDGQFRKFCGVLGRADIAEDPRFATNSGRLANRPALRALIEALLREQPVEALCARLMQAGIPAGAVRSVPDAMTDEHAAHRQVVASLGSYRGIRAAQSLSRTPASVRRPPPTFAEDTRSLLAESGYGEREIETLIESGVAPLQRRVRAPKMPT